MSNNIITPFEKSVHDLAMLHTELKFKNSSPSASTLASSYSIAYDEIERFLKQKRFDPIQEAPAWTE